METFSNILDLGLRIILLLLTAASFFPQLYNIYRHKSYDGLSPGYATIFLISATQQFSIMIYYFSMGEAQFKGIVTSPPRPGDWLNLFQTVTLFVCQLILFVSILYYIPTYRQKAKYLSIYLLFLSITLLPLLVIISKPWRASDRYPIWDKFMWISFQSGVVDKTITTLVAVAYFPQAAEIKKGGLLGRRPGAALSIQGLGIQTVLFVLLGVSWVFRLRLPPGLHMFPPSRPGEAVNFLEYFLIWYHLVGFVAVNNFFFAIVQGLLFLLARETLSDARVGLYEETEREPERDGEREPLLG